MASALTFGLAYWAVVFAVAFGCGVVRTLVVAPWIGIVAAVSLEVPLLLGASYVVARALLARHPLELSQRVAAGAFAFALLMVAEAGLAVTLSGQSFVEWAAGLVRMPGILGLAGQLGFAFIPALVTGRTTA